MNKPARDKEPEAEQRRAIDWDRTRRLVQESRAALDRALIPTPLEKENILKQRARALARKTVRDEAEEGTLEVAEFLLAHERYAIETEHIREVYGMHDLTVLPCTPPFVMGVINVRGRILSVIDLKKFFNLPDGNITNLNKAIILGTGRMEFGILADEIVGIRKIGLDNLQPCLSALTAIGANYLKGIAEDNLIVLDAVKILTDRNIIVHEEV